MPTENSSPSTSVARLLGGPAPVVILLACHFVLGTSAAARKSLTFDEGVHLAGGFSYWAANDYRLHPENGNWPQRWAALPLVASHFQYPALDILAWQKSNLWEMSDRFLFESGNDLDSILFRGRAMIGATSVALGLIVYLWSRRLFGQLGGLISLTLYAFSPTMLANGFLTTSDLFATLFFTVSVGAWWRLLHDISPWNILLAALAVGGLLVSKFSGALFVPMAVVMAGIRLSDVTPLRVNVGRARKIEGLWRQLATLISASAVVALGAALVIWASYGFRYAAFNPAFSDETTQFQITWQEVDGLLPSHFVALTRFAREYHLLPESYLFGFSFMVATGARVGFLNGQCSQVGWISYFPTCFTLKTPLAVFGLVGLAVGAWRVYGRGTKSGAKENLSSPRPTLYALTPLLVLWIIYWLFALSSSLNIGHRHVLPTYPPLFILAGAAALWFQPLPEPASKKGRRTCASGSTEFLRPQVVSVIRGTIVAAVVLSATVALWSWPNYLAYFNLLAGWPSSAYRHLVDSSLDWGQDLKGLKQWLDRHPDDARDPERVYFSYFGMARPEYYGIETKVLPGFRPRWDPHVPQPLTGGLYCLSATMLQPAYMSFPGYWNAVYERNYQQLRSEIEQAARDGADVATFEKAAPHLTSDELQRAFRNYEDLRYGRLAAFLRQREPDAEIGYSILIYRLSDDDVRRALEGPPPQPLPAKPEIGGAQPGTKGRPQ